MNGNGVDTTTTCATLFGAVATPMHLKYICSTAERCVKTYGKPRSGRMGGTSE